MHSKIIPNTRASVVKIGGSLLESATLDSLLQIAGSHGAVVAPGGGPFADAVRHEQSRLKFGDDAAHAMAILAMEQMAFLLAERAAGLTLCATPDEFAHAAAAARGAIWRAGTMGIAADLPRAWQVTSDSLALWLATTLRAPRLVLLKAAEVPAGGSPSDWSAAGLVDAAFPAGAERYDGEILCLGPADPVALDKALSASARIAA